MKPLPQVTKKILKADYVQLTWSDINSDSSWKNLKDAMKSTPTICISTGWLIKKDLNVHIIVADVNFEDDGSLGDVGNITTIPQINLYILENNDSFLIVFFCFVNNIFNS